MEVNSINSSNQTSRADAQSTTDTKRSEGLKKLKEEQAALLAKLKKVRGQPDEENKLQSALVQTQYKINQESI
ncbi:MAG: hypothetical protein HYY52_03030 [Candidatus Melainabacteria bacterium]|nr:hypothetical protein [Candidatus Melainabacteria bacterium]